MDHDIMTAKLIMNGGIHILTIMCLSINSALVRRVNNLFSSPEAMINKVNPMSGIKINILFCTSALSERGSVSALFFCSLGGVLMMLVNL